MGPELWEAPARGEPWSCSLERNLEAEKPYGAMVQLLRNPAFLIVGGGRGGGGGGPPPIKQELGLHIEIQKIDMCVDVYIYIYIY